MHFLKLPLGMYVLSGLFCGDGCLQRTSSRVCGLRHPDQPREIAGRIDSSCLPQMEKLCGMIPVLLGQAGEDKLGLRRLRR